MDDAMSELYEHITATVCQRFLEQHPSLDDLTEVLKRNWRKRLTCYTGLPSKEMNVGSLAKEENIGTSDDFMVLNTTQKLTPDSLESHELTETKTEERACSEETTEEGLTLQPLNSMPLEAFCGVMTARIIKFGYRGIRHGFLGRVENIILTLPRKLEDRRQLKVGFLFWTVLDQSDQDRISGHLLQVVSYDGNENVGVTSLRDKSFSWINWRKLYQFHEVVVKTGRIQLWD
ncbi:hypothetical protein ABG067_004146 [Albugo candida]